MSSSKIYFSSLDALRFFAAFGVIGAHMAAWLPWEPTVINKWIRAIITLDGSSGKAGVSFFFTLSGFLITYLMYEEKSKTSSFSVKNFYIRRALRIWPLYFMSLFIGFVIYPWVTANSEFQETANWKMYALFLANFDHVYHGLPRCGMLGVQWSIAVEEQFYLLWPLVFVFLGTKKYFNWICMILIGISFLFQLSGGDYFHSLTALNDLAMGALLAYFAFHASPSVAAFFQSLTKTRTVIIYALGILLLISNYQLTTRFIPYTIVDDLLHSIFFGFVIMEQNYSPHSLYKFGSIKLFTWLGKISYGIYLLHMVAIYMVLFLITKVWLPIGMTISLVILLTIGLSFISYRYFESPFLRMKEKFNG